MSRMRFSLVSVALLSLGLHAPAQAQQATMGFFVTSVGSGKGADLGGIAGADQHCQMLAQGAGAGSKAWRAYLSTQGPGAINARDRIGPGPWANAKGVVIAKDVAELHGANNLTKQTALTEKGAVVNGRGDTPNMHDVLTGSQPDGTAFAGADDAHAATGRRVRRAPRWSAIPTARGSMRVPRRNPGTRRTSRAGRAAAAARTI